MMSPWMGSHLRLHQDPSGTLLCTPASAVAMTGSFFRHV